MKKYLIERQAVIDIISNEKNIGMGIVEYFIRRIRALPVESEQKVGRWILHPEWEINGECSATCSECEMGVDVLYNFCPRCGAKMENKEWQN